MADSNKRVSRIPTTKGRGLIPTPETKPKPAAVLNKARQSQLPLPQRIPISRWTKPPSPRVVKESKPIEPPVVSDPKVVAARTPKQPNIANIQDLEISVKPPMSTKNPLPHVSTSEEIFLPGEELSDLIVTIAAPVELHQVVSDPKVEDNAILKQLKLVTLQPLEKRLENPETIENVNPPMFTSSNNNLPSVKTSQMRSHVEWSTVTVPIAEPVELHEDVSDHKVEDTMIPNQSNLAALQDHEKRLEDPETIENVNPLMFATSTDDFPRTFEDISQEEEFSRHIVTIAAPVELNEDVSDYEVDDIYDYEVEDAYNYEVEDTTAILIQPQLSTSQDFEKRLDEPETLENVSTLMFANFEEHFRTTITSGEMSQEEEKFPNLLASSEEISKEEEFPDIIASSEEVSVLTDEMKKAIEEFYRNEEEELKSVPVTIDSTLDRIRASNMPFMIENEIVPVPQRFLPPTDKISWARLEDTTAIGPNFESVGQMNSKKLVVLIPRTLKLEQDPKYPYKYSGEVKISNREDKVLIYKVMVQRQHRYVVQPSFGYIEKGAEAAIRVGIHFSSSKEKLEATDDGDSIMVVIAQTLTANLNKDGLKSQWEYVQENLQNSIQTYKIDKIQYAEELASESMQTLSNSDTCQATDKYLQDVANQNTMEPVEWESFSPALVDQDVAEISRDVDAIFTWGSYGLYATGMLVVLGLAYKQVQEIAISLPLETEGGGFWSSWIPFIKR